MPSAEIFVLIMHYPFYTGATIPPPPTPTLLPRPFWYLLCPISIGLYYALLTKIALEQYMQYTCEIIQNTVQGIFICNVTDFLLEL